MFLNKQERLDELTWPKHRRLVVAGLVSGHQRADDFQNSLGFP